MAFQSPLLSLVAGIVLFLLLQKWRKRSPLPLPPGPSSLPFIGNLLDIPTNGAPGFRDLCTKYGDIVHLDVAGRPMIILGSQEVALELLDKRSLNYSDRVSSPMVDIVGLGWSFIFWGRGSSWRRSRRAFHQFFNQNAVQNYTAYHQLEAHRLVMRLIDKPDAFVHHIRHLFGSSIMRIVYGIEVDDEAVDYLKMAEDAAAIFSEMLRPGKYLMESLPFLRYLPSWFPGATVKRKGVAWRQVTRRLLEEPWKFAMTTMEEGTARPSMATSLMADTSQPYGESKDMSEDEEIYRNTAATTYGGGADTVLSTVHTFFLAMATHPQVLKKAQADLDAVVGPHRLPNYQDMESLPYIHALVKELLRWRVVGPIGFPHCASDNDEYRGYFIPKGSIVVANIWAISHDPSLYCDPEAFEPERFLKNGKLDPDVRDPATFAFGYGRRICPGRHYATSMLFIVVATVLHTMSITAPLDEDGKPVRLEGKMTEGLIAHPEPFECVIKPRSEEAVALIKASCGSIVGLHE